MRPTYERTEMEIALAVVFIFTVMIIVMTVSIPLMVISRILRMLKNSVAKLTKSHPKKA